MLSIKGVTVPFLVIVAFLAVSSISGCTSTSSSTNEPGTVPDAASVMGGGGTDPVDLVNEAWSLNAQEKFSEANTLLDRASSLDPSTPGLAFNRGWALTGLGRYNEALTALDQALAENPGSAISWSNKGYALAHLGRCEEAKTAYMRAHDLEPTNRAIMSSLNSIGSHCSRTVTVPPTTAPITTRPVAQTTTKRTTGTLSAADLGTVWTVREKDVFVMKELPGAGNFEGTWTRRPGTDTFDARMTGGVVSGAPRDDVIDIVSVTGNTIVMYSHDINGQYTGTISPDGKSINGKGDWYEPTGTWTVTIA